MHKNVTFTRERFHKLLNINIDVFKRMFLFIFGTFMEIDRCCYTNNNFAENSSSVLTSTNLNKKAIDKDDGNGENFLLMLFNSYIYP